jgi:hypothetical protein
MNFIKILISLNTKIHLTSITTFALFKNKIQNDFLLGFNWVLMYLFFQANTPSKSRPFVFSKLVHL